LEETAAIILAAGKSTRMKTELPKVLHPICGQPMLAYVLSACRDAGVDRLLVVVGHGKEEVVAHFSGQSDVRWVEQTKQKGTGHAVFCCREALTDFDGSVLVIAGDMPLVRRETLANLLETRENCGDAVVIATTVLEGPHGYGRIVRDDTGKLLAIVEDRDCTPEQRTIREVNPSYYCFDCRRMFEALENLRPDNVKGEYYITDAVHILRDSGGGASAIETVPAEDAMGINSRLDLAVVGRAMQDRIQLAIMQEGVTIVDPDNTWIEAGVSIGRDTVVYPFTFIGTGAALGERCRVGPFARIAAQATVGDDAVVEEIGVTDLLSK
jgi:bifunctional UDP-N-acetylglucosamine pyrophosphorylase/glucosamine-1-phosphate N-acetyltransferase